MVTVGRDGVPSARPLTPRAPWWALHIVTLAAAACLLWAFSVPGFSFFLVFGAVPVLGLAGLAWVVWVVMFGVHRRRWSWSFLPAPMIVALVLALLAAGVPLQARWAMSRGAFEQAVATLPAGEDWYLVPAPSTIGSYRIIAAYHVPGGVVFQEANGNLFDDAGFAYLPEGPTPALENGSFESPVFQHLGGAWYRWTASW